MNHNWMNGMNTAGLSDYQKQQMMLANGAGMGMAAGMGGMGMGNMGGMGMGMGGVMTTAQKQQMLAQQAMAQQQMLQQQQGGHAQPSPATTLPQLAERVAILEGIVRGQGNSGKPATGDRFAGNNAYVAPVTNMVQKPEVEKEGNSEYVAGSRFLTKGFGNFQKQLGEKNPKVETSEEVGEKIMSTSIKIDSDAVIGKILNVDDRIDGTTIDRVGDLYDSLRVNGSSGFTVSMNVTCDAYTVPKAFLDSGLLTNNPEKMSSVLKGLLDKADNPSDKGYFELVDDLISERVNDYLLPTYGGALKSYAYNFSDATQAICDRYSIVQSTFEKEIGDIVSDTIIKATRDIIANIDEDEEIVNKETEAVGVSTANIITYLHHGSREIGLGYLNDFTLKQIDPNSTSSALMEAYASMVEQCKRINRTNYVTTYLVTRDRKVFKLVRNKEGNVFIARHAYRS